VVDLLACSLIVPWDGGTPPALPIGRPNPAAQSTPAAWCRDGRDWGRPMGLRNQKERFLDLPLPIAVQ
jgi:hypothetical protein